MVESTLSARHQIVIPKEARQALGIKAGDKLLVVVRSDRVIVLQKSERRHTAVRGLAEHAYPDGYLEKERGSWE